MSNLLRRNQLRDMNLHAGFLYYKNDTNENECQLILKSFCNVIFLSKKRKNAGKKFDN